MYTNKLLEEKYKVQKELSREAKCKSENYFEVIEKSVKKLFEREKWDLAFSSRKGGYLKTDSHDKKTG